MILELIADRGDVRIDAYLSESVSEISRSYAVSLITDGLVLMNNKKIKPSAKTTVGASIVVDLPEPQMTHTLPENIPLDIVYEDKDLLVINKPQGMVVHPAP